MVLESLKSFSPFIILFLDLLKYLLSSYYAMVIEDTKI